MYQTVSQLLNNPLKLVYLNEQYMQETFKFKDHDIQFLKLFWQPDFDESWFLLDEPFIETWLIQEHLFPSTISCQLFRPLGARCF